LPVKNHSRLFFYFHLWIFFLCLIPGTALWGQEEEYRLEENGRFVQILRWKSSENALYYEVEIEILGRTGWESVMTQKTRTLFCEVSLAPGTYHYRVRAYDFLDRPGEAAEWIQFEVLRAKQPELLYFTPKVVYPEGDKSVTITIEGRNLSQGIRIYLQREGEGEKRIPAETITVDQTEEEARVTFSREALEPGDYTIRAINPGGLSTSLGIFRKLVKKFPAFDLWLGYAPLISLNNGGGGSFDPGFFPGGASGRLKFLPIVEGQTYLGLELEASWNQLRVKWDGNDLRGELIGGAGYGIYQWWFLKDQCAINIRVGGGAYRLLAPHQNSPEGTEKNFTLSIPAIITGFSFQWRIKNSFFMEGGLDFTYPLNVDSPSWGYLRPFLGAGYRF
jgi:hypothetical protein